MKHPVFNWDMGVYIYIYTVYLVGGFNPFEKY